MSRTEERPSSTPPTDRAYLDELAERSRRAQARADALVGPLSSSQLNWKPHPDAWSVGQCLDHVVTTNRLYLTSIDRALSNARPAPADRPFEPGPLGRRFAALMGPGGRRRVKTVKPFVPSASALGVSVLADFATQQGELRDTLRRAATVDLTSTRVTSPASRLIRFRLGDILLLLVNHQDRHLDQAERVTMTDGYPATGEET